MDKHCEILMGKKMKYWWEKKWKETRETSWMDKILKINDAKIGKWSEKLAWTWDGKIKWKKIELLHNVARVDTLPECLLRAQNRSEVRIFGVYNKK